MDQQDCYIVTGAAGFIGSYLIGRLNRLGFRNLVLVDRFGRADREKNLDGKQFLTQIDRDDFPGHLPESVGKISGVFHLGARTDTTEMDYEVHRVLNLDYSKAVWNFCTTHKIPLVYASSAATYGNGELGYSDDAKIATQLHPLNPYGQSKADFDIWALAQESAPPFWAGVKFFNVFGPNEYHKGRMASVVLHAYRQIQSEGFLKLFRSHNPDYPDGGQLRDFIHVDDITSICLWLMESQPPSGLYNGGTGKAHTFLELAQAIFRALDKQSDIRFIDTPADIRDKYQYFTEADTKKLRNAGYEKPFYDLDVAVGNYVREFLKPNLYF